MRVLRVAIVPCPLKLGTSAALMSRAAETLCFSVVAGPAKEFSCGKRFWRRYGPARAAYAQAFWNVVDWAQVSRTLAGAGRPDL